MVILQTGFLRDNINMHSSIWRLVISTEWWWEIMSDCRSNEECPNVFWCEPTPVSVAVGKTETVGKIDDFSERGGTFLLIETRPREEGERDKQNKRPETSYFTSARRTECVPAQSSKVGSFKTESRSWELNSDFYHREDGVANHVKHTLF